MTDDESPSPKIFISYSWTSDEHEEWVVDLAERLTRNGIHVVFDKWDLREGHDKYQFMERMVTDEEIDKVLVICDSEYAEKADRREGGVGTESQIISPEIYEEVEQQKFIPVVTERGDDGRPCVPRFLEGRIFIDMSPSANQGEEYTKLVRAIFGKPIYRRPPIGTPPTYVMEDEPLRISTSAQADSARDAVKNARSYALGAVEDYLGALCDALEDARIGTDEAELVEHLDELIVEKIGRYQPYRDEFAGFVRLLARYWMDSRAFESLHSFFEASLRLTDRPNSGMGWNDASSDPIRFLRREFFLVAAAVLIEARRFSELNALLARPYFYSHPHRSGYRTYGAFDSYLRSLDEVRNRRLELGRRSLTADLLRDRAEPSGPDFSLLVDTDFLLFVRAVLDSYASESNLSGKWYPRTIVYRSRDFHSELIERLRSKSFFEDAKPIFGVESKEELVRKFEQLPEEQTYVREGFLRITSGNLASAVKLDSIATIT